MNMNFIRSQENLSEQDINEFESTFEIKLPQELKQLLLKFNGGILDGEIEGYAFAFLRPIKYGANTLEVAIDDLQITEQHIPRHEIPFADDMGGNVFTISTAEEDYGAIYYWALDLGDPQKNFVANSLIEFFQGKEEE